MGDCCDVSNQLHQKKNVLIAVLIINAVMFFSQFSAALVGHSTSLLADSFDMLGDAFAYAVSLYAVNKGGAWLARAAFIKGVIIAIFGVGIIFEAVIKTVFTEAYPHVTIMSVFGILGLIANGVCLYLLTRHRNQDINMRSTWICARNDIIGNVAVLITAGLVFVLNSRWPDIIIGCLLAIVLLRSAYQIIRDSIQAKTA